MSDEVTIGKRAILVTGVECGDWRIEAIFPLEEAEEAERLAETLRENEPPGGARYVVVEGDIDSDYPLDAESETEDASAAERVARYAGQLRAKQREADDLEAWLVDSVAGRQVRSAEKHLMAADLDERPVVAFAHRREASRLLKEVAKAIDSDLDAADETVQNYLLEQGVASLKLSDPAVTLFLDRRPWMTVVKLPEEGKDVTPAHERLAAALREMGLDEFARMRVNLQGLTAHYREQLEELGEEALNERLAEELGGTARMGVTIKVKTRTAG